MSSEIDPVHISLLQNYFRRGYASRIKTLMSLIEKIDEKNTQREDEFRAKNTGLSNTEKQAALQIASISVLMIYTEDLIAICMARLENHFDYYKYLDSKEEDLGKLLFEFVQKIPQFSESDLRKILGYMDPEKFEFDSDQQKSTMEKIISKNCSQTQEFLQRISDFRGAHVAIFRRFKHAGFPIFLSQQIQGDNKEYQRFDFVSVAATSKNDPNDEITTIPFSKQVIKSYRSLGLDISTFLGTILDSYLTAIYKNQDGIMPKLEYHFSENYSDLEKEVCEKVWKKFDKKFPSKPIKARTIVGTIEDPVWYLSLDRYTDSFWWKD